MGGLAPERPRNLSASLRVPTVPAMAPATSRLVWPLQAIDGRPQPLVTYLALGRGCSGLEGLPSSPSPPSCFPWCPDSFTKKGSSLPNKEAQRSQLWVPGDPAICWAASVCPVAGVTRCEEPVRAAGWVQTDDRRSSGLGHIFPKWVRRLRVVRALATEADAVAERCCGRIGSSELELNSACPKPLR